MKHSPAALLPTLAPSLVVPYSGRVASLFDPRDKALLSWLASLPEREELVARLAINGLCDRCRGDVPWKRRVAELRRKYATGPAKLAALMRDADAMSARFRAEAESVG